MDPQQLDDDRWALNCLNGTIDLRTGTLRRHDRHDLITTLAPVVYDPDAQLDVWDRFLRQATGGDLELERFLARLVGYSLTGLTSEEVMALVHGPGGSGKSSFKCLQRRAGSADTADSIHKREDPHVRIGCSLLISTVALAAALTACGDGGISKSEFTAKADGSCVVGNTAISSAAKPTNAPGVATSAGTAVTTIDGQVGMLRGLKMPGGKDKAQIEGVINAIAEVSGPTKALQEAAGKNDDAAMTRAVVEMRTKVDGAAASAQAYGLTQCGTGLKPAVANLFEGAKSVVKSSYVTKAEGLCRDAYRKANAMAAPGSSLASVSRYIDTQLVIFNKLVTDLKAVPAPPGDEATVGEFVTAFDAFTAKIKEVGAAAKANNPRLYEALSEEADVATTALDAKLDAYGLKTCGTSGV